MTDPLQTELDRLADEVLVSRKIELHHAARVLLVRAIMWHRYRGQDDRSDLCDAADRYAKAQSEYDDKWNEWVDR